METKLNTKKVVMYSLPGCPFCIKAKTLLSEKGVDFEDFDVSQPEGKDSLKERGYYKTVPQIFVDDKNIGGHDDLLEIIKNGTFDNLFLK